MKNGDKVKAITVRLTPRDQEVVRKLRDHYEYSELPVSQLVRLGLRKMLRAIENENHR